MPGGRGRLVCLVRVCPKAVAGPSSRDRSPNSNVRLVEASGVKQTRTWYFAAGCSMSRDQREISRTLELFASHHHAGSAPTTPARA